MNISFQVKTFFYTLFAKKIALPYVRYRVYFQMKKKIKFYKMAVNADK